MEHQQTTKAIVSVAEMARMVGLSRARFYELIDDGIFPKPSRHEELKRPYYDKSQQEQCLSIRRTNCGANGKAVLFYSQRLDQLPVPRLPSRRRRQSGEDRGRATNRVPRDPIVEGVCVGLGQLGMVEVKPVAVLEALRQSYPDGWADKTSTELLMSVFRSLQRQNSPDILAK